MAPDLAGPGIPLVDDRREHVVRIRAQHRRNLDRLPGPRPETRITFDRLQAARP